MPRRQPSEGVRRERIGRAIESLVLDLRYAARGLRKAPGFTAVAVLTLALGIGAHAAIFSVVHRMLIAPLPYRDADRLSFIWLNLADVGYGRAPLAGMDLRDLRRGSRTFAEFGAIWASGTVALTGDGDPEQLRSAFVTTNFFQVLGADSALGRTFRPEDSAPGAHPTVLLGWDLFERRFGADPTIVGREIVVNDEPTTVIGVMPKTFRLLLPPGAAVPDRLQVWQPFWPDLEQGGRGQLFLRVVGRMQPGVTIEQARAEIDGIASQMTGESGAKRAFTTVALQADDVREIRGPLVALFVGVGILLVIACVNVASLLVARAAARARETALRLALGASRGRLLRHSLAEAFLLTTLGAVAGLLVGAIGVRALVALAPESLNRLDASRLDVTVVVFTVLIACSGARSSRSRRSSISSERPVVVLGFRAATRCASCRRRLDAPRQRLHAIGPARRSWWWRLRSAWSCSSGLACSCAHSSRSSTSIQGSRPIDT